MATPGDILTATEALERMQQMGGDSEASSAALEKVGQNITNSSIFGVGKPKTKGTLESAEKTRQNAEARA